MSPASRSLNSPLIHTHIYLELSSHLGLDVKSHIPGINTHAQTPHTTQRRQRG
uniref:Uncharacterized protein n=1 Tax=Mesocestoides corti TaxID=53468 RepID=A0A5K3EHC3_MESCO